MSGKIIEYLFRIFEEYVPSMLAFTLRLPIVWFVILTYRCYFNSSCNFNIIVNYPTSKLYTAMLPFIKNETVVGYMGAFLLSFLIYLMIFLWNKFCLSIFFKSGRKEEYLSMIRIKYKDKVENINPEKRWKSANTFSIKAVANRLILSLILTLEELCLILIIASFLLNAEYFVLFGFSLVFFLISILSVVYRVRRFYPLEIFIKTLRNQSIDII